MVTGIDKLSGMTATYERAGGGGVQAEGAKAQPATPSKPSDLDIRKYVAKQEQEIANQPENKADSNNLKSTESEKPEETASQITKLVNDMLANMNLGIKFSVHEKSGKMMVNLINQENQRVVREYPSKEFLDMMAKISQQIGLIIDKKI